MLCIILTSHRLQCPVPPPHLIPVYAQQLLSRLSIQEQKIQLSQQNIQNIVNDFSILKREVFELQETVNNDQQYNRRWNGLIHGLDDVPVAPDKPCQEFNESFTNYVINKLNELFPGLDKPITHSDIDNTHIYRTARFGPKSSKQVVIVRFISMLRRNQIFSLKKTLKDTPISLTEHLTKTNLNLYKEAKKVVGDKKVWTHYGKILVEHRGGIKSIRNKDALYRLCGPRHPYRETYTHSEAMYPVMSQNTGSGTH